MAKREKHVYTDTGEIAHLWASGNKDNARTPTKHFWFEGPFLYSYSTCIGVLLPDNQVLISTYRYSNTTNSQYFDRDRAINHKNVFRVPKIPDNIDYLTYDTTKPKEARVALLKELAQRWTEEMKEEVMGVGIKSRKVKHIARTMHHIRTRAIAFGCKVSQLPKFDYNDDEADENQAKELLLAFRKKYCKREDERLAEQAIKEIERAKDASRHYGLNRQMDEVNAAIKTLAEAATSIELQCTKRDKERFAAEKIILKQLAVGLAAKVNAEKFRFNTQKLEELLAKQTSEENQWWDKVTPIQRLCEWFRAVTCPEGVKENFGTVAVAIAEIGQEVVDRAKAAVNTGEETVRQYRYADLVKRSLHLEGLTEGEAGVLLRDAADYRDKYRKEPPEKQLPDSVAEAEAFAEKVIADHRAQLLEAQKTVIADWKSHTDNPLLKHWNSPLRGLPPLLRLTQDGKQVETSWSARVPVEVCPALWELVQMARDGKKSIVGDFGPAGRVGMYNLNEVCADGGLIVGCHRIAYEEIKYIADLLGYTQQIG